MPEGRVAETMPEVEEAFEEIEVDAPLVGIIIGSKNDKPKLQPAGEVLQEHGISYEVRVLSAHRTPDSTREYCENLGGLDALLSAVQMPPGVPVGCVAIDGAKNAGLLAVRIINA